MKQIIILLVAAALLSGCTATRHTVAMHRESSDSIRDIGNDSMDEKAIYSLVQSWNCTKTKLSDQFDVEIVFEHYVDTITAPCYADSAFVSLLIKDKATGEAFDRIFLKLIPFGSVYYEEEHDVTSFTTGLNADRKIIDNYFGYIVVADLNFDGRDDIAVIYDSGVSSGPYYAFYMQTAKHKFVMDKYLTWVMTYFPDEIDPSRRQLTTYARASAVAVCKSVYSLGSLTHKWRRASKIFIGD